MLVLEARWDAWGLVWELVRREGEGAYHFCGCRGGGWVGGCGGGMEVFGGLCDVLVGERFWGGRVLRSLPGEMRGGLCKRYLFTPLSSSK